MIKSVVGLVYVCFVAFVIAKPTPEANPDLITYSSGLVDHPVYYSYPYLGYSLYTFPYYDFAGSVYHFGGVPSVYPVVDTVHYN